MPASYNDLFADIAVRDHVGDAWYQTDVRVPARWAGERIVLRFDSATHRAVVWVNGTQVAEHEGGYTPFEADVTDVVELGAENRITVVVNNVLTWQSIPPGLVDDGPTGAASATSTTSSTTPASTGRCGCTPRRGRTSPTSPSSPTSTARTGSVRYRVEAAADGLEVRVVLRDAEGAEVAPGDGRRRRARRSPACTRGAPARATSTSSAVELWGDGDAPVDTYAAAGRHPHRAGRRDALPDQRRAVLLQGLRQARGHRRARQGARRRVHGPRLRADGVARRELVPHLALPVRRGGARLRRPPRHRGDRRDRGRGPEHGPGRRRLRHAGVRRRSPRTRSTPPRGRSTARRSRS